MKFSKLLSLLLLSLIFLLVCSNVMANDIDYQIGADNVGFSGNLSSGNDSSLIVDAHDYGDINYHVKYDNNVVINLASGSFDASYTINVASGKHITINGNGAIIKMKGENHRFMNIESGATVVLNNLIIKDFKTQEYHTFSTTSLKGGVFFNDGNLLINNCVFNNNGLDSGEYAYGGVIWNTGYLKINNSNFTNNFIYSYTKSVASNLAQGGVIFNYDGNVYIDNCIFKNNRANDDDKKGRQNSEGGVIFNYGRMKEANLNKGNLIISNSKFIDNEVDSKCQSVKVINRGGAICNEGILKITDCEFINNNAWSYSVSGTCKAYGGAICNRKDSLVIIEGDCIFSNNRAHTGDSHNYGYGGAISNEGGKVIVNSTSVRFINNMALSGKSIYSDSNTINFNNYLSESFDYDIDMVASSSGSWNVSTINEIISIVGAFNYRNFVFNLQSDCKVNNAIVVGPNKNVIINGNGFTVNGNKDLFLVIEAGNVTLNNLIIKDCRVKGYSATSVTDIRGGSIRNHGALTINNCLFNNNGVDSGEYAYGGCIYNTGDLTINNSIFDSNYAFSYTVTQTKNYAYGGAIASLRGNVKIYNCIFKDNIVNKDHDNGQYGYGGAIFNKGEMYVINSTFIGNTINSDVQAVDVYNYGGAIFNDNFISIMNCNFKDNFVFADSNTGTCKSFGGAIHTTNNAKTVIFGNCSFIHNGVDTDDKHHYSYGGAISNDGDTIMYGIITMKDNFAHDGSNIYGSNKIELNGLGYYLLDGNFVIGNESYMNKTYLVQHVNDIVNFINRNETNIVINLNKGNYLLKDVINIMPGQIITINGNGAIIDCDNNRFMDIEGSTVYLNNLTIKHCFVSDYTWVAWEKASVKGGSIINNGELFIDGCIFDNCGIDSGEFAYGGVIYNLGNLNISNTNFTNNFARSHTVGANDNYANGGVIYNEKGYVSISNCVFKDNNLNKDQDHAQYGYGGAIFNKGEMYVINSTFIGNTIDADVQAEDVYNYGGAIFNDNFISIMNCNFKDNFVFADSNTGTCKSFGGAIHTTDNAKTVIFGNCSFINNGVDTGDKHHYGYGGAISNDGITLVDCDYLIMKDNTAKYGSDLYGRNSKILFNGVACKELDGDINISDDGIAKFSYNLGGKVVFFRMVDYTYVNGTTITGKQFMTILLKAYGYNITENSTFNFNNFIDDVCSDVGLNVNMTDDELLVAMDNIGKYVNNLIFNNFNSNETKSFTYLTYSQYNVVLSHTNVINSDSELIEFANKYNSNPEQWTSLTLYLNKKEYSVDGSVFDFAKSLKNLEINGNNSIVKVKNPDDDEEYHFLFVHQGQYVILNGLVLSGFNTAVRNEGILFVLNCTFDGNRMDYDFDQDFGGAIKNLGSLYCINSTFINNYAKYGGAIYNKNAFCSIYNCTFKNNVGYGHGNDIYNFDKVALLINYTDCELYYGTPLSEWAQKLIIFGIGIVLTGITVVISIFAPGPGTMLAGIIWGAVVGAISGAAGGVISSFIISATNHIEEKGSFIGHNVINSAISGAIIGAITGAISTRFNLINKVKPTKLNKFLEYFVPNDVYVIYSAFDTYFNLINFFR